MKVLVVGAGVLGSWFAVRLQDAGHDVSVLARGARLASLRAHGVQLAVGDDPTVRAVMVPVVEQPEERYDLIVVLVRSHQVDAVLAQLAPVGGDVLFLLNWAAGPEALGAVIGSERVLLGFPTAGAGAMDGDVARARPASAATRFVAMPIGEPDGAPTPRLERVVALFRGAGIRAKAEPRMDAWLRTHAAFEVPLGQAVLAAGGPRALAGDREALLTMVGRMRRGLAALPVTPVPRAFAVLPVLPERVLATVLRRFLRSPLASPLGTDSPATRGEYALLAEQLEARTGSR